MKSRHPLLAGFPVAISVPLLWGDEDSFGHVNNTIYLRWVETARVVYLQRIGMWQKRPDHLGPILASMSCEYRKAISYPDTVHIGSRVTRVGNTSFKMEHVIVSANLDLVSAEVDSTLVVLDYVRGKPVPVPAQVREAIEELEGKAAQLR